MVTSSPTIGAYLPAPKSLRLIRVLALAPMASFLAIGWAMLAKWLTFNTTGLVTPLMVRLPSMVAGASPSNTTLVDLKVAVGNLPVSRKSAPWMWLLNRFEPVSTEVMSMVMSTEPVLAALSYTMVPLVLLNLLIWVDRPMWLYEKFA